MDNPLKNKRILIFLRSFEVGGAERQAVMLANYLVKNEKAKVAVWAYSDPGPLLDLLDKNISWKSIPFNMENQKTENINQRKKDLWRLSLKILYFRPHIILPFTITPNVDCGYIWKLTFAKSCIWNQRDEWLEFLDYPENEIEVKSFKNTPIFVSNSKRGKEIILEKLKGDSRTIQFIPNSVFLRPPQKSPSQWRKKIKATNKTIIATMVANLTENKDHVTLLEAWKIVINKTKQDDKPILVLAGRFDHTQDKLKALAKKLKIENYVKFLGFVRDIPGLLAASNIALFSSKSEGCPNGILESMAAKLPIISYRIRGVEDILGKNYPFFAPVGDEKAMSKVILKLIADKDERKKIGMENYDKVIKEYRPEITFKKYSDIIEKALKDSKINFYNTIKKIWRFRKSIKKSNDVFKN